MCPLTDGRDAVTRSGQKTDQMWACHNDARRAEAWVSPREPGYDITPSEAGQGDSVARGFPAAEHRIAQPFYEGKAPP